MSLHRFFLETQVLSQVVSAPEGMVGVVDAGKDACERYTDEFLLDVSDEDAKHAKVIRLKPGEHIAVIDAQGDYFECEIRRIDNDGIHVVISQHLDAPQDCCSVTLFQGLAKGERFEAVLKHATELGVSAFVPLMCERCVVRLDAKKIPSKINRWKTIVKNAAKQAGLHFIPIVEEPQTFHEAIESLSDFDLVLICWEEAMGAMGIRATIGRATLAYGAKIAIVVGPEGGISDSETSSMLSGVSQAKLVSLGPTILRTETAGIVSCALALDALREELKQ